VARVQERCQLEVTEHDQRCEKWMDAQAQLIQAVRVECERSKVANDFAKQVSQECATLLQKVAQVEGMTQQVGQRLDQASQRLD
jgi:hypothetical protein